MNTVLVTEIKCVMLFLFFLISVMYILEQFLTRKRGLIKFYAEYSIWSGAAPTCAPELVL